MSASCQSVNRVCVLLLLVLACLCTLPSSAALQILRPTIMQDVVQRTAWMPYGPSQWTGRSYQGTIVWLPPHALCSSIDDAAALDSTENLPQPVTHFGPLNYTEVSGAVALFAASHDCPLLNQLFYVEAVLGATGAVVHAGGPSAPFPPIFNTRLTAPVTHIPAVAVTAQDYEVMRAAVVDRGVLVEVLLGWSTSEMHYG